MAKLLRNGFLINGTGEEPQKGIDVLIEGNVITDIGTNLSIPGGYRHEDIDIIDLQGKTIMLGMTESPTSGFLHEVAPLGYELDFGNNKLALLTTSVPPLSLIVILKFRLYLKKYFFKMIGSKFQIIYT